MRTRLTCLPLALVWAVTRATGDHRRRYPDVLGREDHPVAARLGDGALAAATRICALTTVRPTGAGSPELHGDLVGLFGGGGDVAFLDGDAVLLEDGLALEFVRFMTGC